MSGMSGLKAAFEGHRNELLVSRARVAAGMAAVMIPGGGLLEVLAYPEYAHLFWSLRVPFAGLAALVFALSYGRWGRHQGVLLSTGVTLVVGLGVVLVLLAGPGLTSPYYAGVSVVMITAAVLFPWSLPESAGVNGLLMLSYLAPAIVAGPEFDQAVVITNAYFLLNFAIITVVGTHLGTRLRAREFAAREGLLQRSEQLDETAGWLKASLARLEEADRAKSRFFAQVSHELRTPLTLVLAPVDELLTTELPAPALQRLRMVRRNAAHLLHLINRLLDVARLQSSESVLHRSPIDLTSYLPDLADLYRELAESRGQRFEVSVAGDGRLLADPQHLETILRNLVSNALKFSPEGSLVQLRAGAGEGGRWIEVEDCGGGVPEREREQIFDLFTRGKGAEGRVEGTGIGLSLVRELARLHGGETTVAQGDEGAIFRVTFPEVEDPVAAAKPVVHEVGAEGPSPELADEQLVALEGAGGARGRSEDYLSELVLVVEDDPDLRRFTANILSQLCQVEAVATAEEALEFVQRSPPSAVVSDVMLPGESGISLTQRLKGNAASAEIPVILLTARRGADAMVEGFSEGADDYMEKPFQPQELLARVQAQLRVRTLSRGLSEARKMAMLGTLSAGLAHEVRNPAGAIINATPIIREELKRALGPRAEGSVAAELLRVVEESAHRIANLVGDLLHFSHLESSVEGEWRPTDGIENVLRLLRHRQTTVQLEAELAFEGAVPGVAGRLDQVVMNLLDNAFRAAGAEGQVWVRSRKTRGGDLEISVEDSGRGVAPEDRPHIFDPFFTTRAVDEGTGLGLYLSRRIVKSHGGTLELAPRVAGRGARFLLRLPGGMSEENGAVHEQRSG